MPKGAPNPTRMIEGRMQLYKRLRREYEHGLGSIRGVAQKYKSASSDRSGGTEERRSAEAESDSTKTTENDVGHSVHRRHSGKRL
jgi:hypothetical protein